MPSPTSKPASPSASRRTYQSPHPHQCPRHATSSWTDGNTQQLHHSHNHSPLPLRIKLPLQNNSTSASLVPSVAEGRPIPVDDSTVENRTEALRELNSHYPSRHRYAKSTGAENTTYSEPVIVRSYYRPPPNKTNRLPRASSSSTAGIVVVRNGHSTAGSVNGSVASRTRTSPLAGKMASASSGMLSIMARARGQNPPFANRSLPEDAKLPPIEAFSFKSFLENLDQQETTATSSDINADLDRIAEICARSRYSLSNQYEVHYGPHGSGTKFVVGGQHGPENHGPTLQAVTSDDETNTRTERKRRLGGRRNSRAMGTLETIMSSSRSSDEDHSKKESAAEIADDVHGRVLTKTSHHASPTGSTTSAQGRPPQDPPKQRPAVKHTLSSSLALIDGTNKTTTPSSADSDICAPHSAPAVSLVGEPALLQPCTSQLEVHTATSAANMATVTDMVSAASRGRPHTHHAAADRSSNPLPRPAARGPVSLVDGATATGLLLSTLAGWIPWSSGAPTDVAAPQQGRAVGSLRSLLRMVDDGPSPE
ncbi:hypothetical protein MY11210_002676 [Beauveria gryllotalpidicola]